MQKIERTFWNMFFPKIRSLFGILIILFAFIYLLNTNMSCSPPQPTSSAFKNKILKKQTGSVEILFSGTKKNLYSVSRFMASTALTVGQNGIILTTQNGGLNWVTQTSSVSDDLLCTSCLDHDTMLAAGLNGNIIRSTNKGNNWNVVASALTANNLNAMHFPTKFTGFICGNNGTILKSSNSGLTWNILAAPTSKNLYGIFFLSDSSGYVTGDSGKIYSTTDGGTSWILKPSGTTKALKSISFGNTNVGQIVGDTSTILITINGGATWANSTDTVTTADYVSNTFASSNLNYFIGNKGDSGVVYRKHGNSNKKVLTLKNKINDVSTFINLTGPASLSYPTSLIVGNSGFISLVTAQNCETCSDDINSQYDVVLIPAYDDCHWTLNIRLKTDNVYNKYVKIIVNGYFDTHIAGWTQTDGTSTGRQLLDDSRFIKQQNISSGSSGMYNFVNNDGSNYSQPGSYNSTNADLITHSFTSNGSFKFDFTILDLGGNIAGQKNIEIYFGNDSGDCHRCTYTVDCSN